MREKQFAHLHLHSHTGSLLDGAIRIPDLLKKVKKYGMPAVALTDHGNMFGAIDFFTQCHKAGVKPIVGSEVYVAVNHREEKRDPTWHMTLLCKNREGYQNLMKLVSIAQRDGFYYRPRVDRELLREHSGGLIALSGCLKGEVNQLILAGKIDEARDAIRDYDSIFKAGFCLEIMDNSLADQARVNEVLIALGNEMGIPLVATNDCHYLDKDDASAHEVLLAIQTGKTLQDASRMRFSSADYYVKTPEEMIAAFSHIPEAISNTIEIADSCDLELDLKTYHFPQYVPPEGQTLDSLLAEHAAEGLRSRFPCIKARQSGFTVEDEAKYLERLQVELSLISTMGFSGYFLIVADFINWAKNQGIPVGPGRGSAAGSLVAYAIRITDLDPIPYNLLFERFLNPERISMPDIDVDFCQDRREEVIQYMVEKYGREKVAQIITFGTMAARGVIRDVARVLDIPLSDANRIAKMIPPAGVSLAEAMDADSRLKEMSTEVEFSKLFEVALKLEGLSRHASTHAAGVVIAPGPMSDYAPIVRDPKTGTFNTQYDMKSVEKIGLVKFDFLGLKNLTAIADAEKLVRRRHDKKFAILNIPLDDPAAYKLLQAGDTIGVFQLESSGIRELLKKMEPTCFEDIIAVCALYRPGPLGSGMVDDFVERKHGRKQTVYDLPQLEPILKDTYGVIVYQEQVMQIARSLAGYSLGGADLLRRAMGKKDADQMAKERDKFLEGAVTQGIEHQKAEAIFDLMAKFAEYGFNKSHSAAYALIAYQTAYLKAHYPLEFNCALLSVDIGTDKAIKDITDCRGHSIQVMIPDINESDRLATITKESIRFGLNGIANVGGSAIDAILEARGKGRFSDLFDFCQRVDLRWVNKRVVESLAKGGAFESFGISRRQSVETIEAAMSWGAEEQKSGSGGQGSLFGSDIMNPRPKVVNIGEWDEKERLDFEKEVLGLYLSGHPMSNYAEIVRHNPSTILIEDALEKSDNSSVQIAGIVIAFKEILTRRGDKMAFVTLEDISGCIEAVIFADAYAECRDFLTLATNHPLLLVGYMSVDESKIAVRAKSVSLLRLPDNKITKIAA